ncbi:TetR family transcriptional regulator [Mycobacterium intermedium]|uniref:TetR family transcriptional regulator n=1 Tax=Mycobacterium intermedium TaxID=28445 RepID=A0A1E3SJE6_MYCIE|nr:TetR/AcrR family transcriptional regulator [Mycobacterium intermedium]MCV6963772.1 TetR/AcrR family transcriptional regulator [Mycobacterium intermedium]ODR02245.1 TetR family transcriptional regulator [Mycobacterium intermedium]OPE48375.1 TetR family transcriptional regulator [Mycobacterium intermedium]ORA97598.1 TetR family transcriptional regulator [Mycobacterium intermedium]
MPKISAASVGEHREQVQRRVFEAFASLMAEQSFDAITMAQLAAAAGIGRTAIYHHFADKEAVVVAFASHETSRYIDELRATLQGIDDPVERLKIYINHQLDAGHQFHIGLGPQLYGALSRDTFRAIREHVMAIEDVLRDILASGASTGQFVIEDVATTISLIHACLAPRDLPVDAVERFVLRALRGTR